jgi:hypothetical protein
MQNPTRRKTIAQCSITPQCTPNRKTEKKQNRVPHRAFLSRVEVWSGLDQQNVSVSFGVGRFITLSDEGRRVARVHILAQLNQRNFRND